MWRTILKLYSTKLHKNPKPYGALLIYFNLFVVKCTYFGRSSQSNSWKWARVTLLFCINDKCSCFRTTSPQAPRSPRVGERHGTLNKSVDRYAEYR